MNCPSCGAPMHPLGASLKCDYCGTVVVPDRDTSGVRVLAETTDEQKRQTLLKLLADEEARDAPQAEPDLHLPKAKQR